MQETFLQKSKAVTSQKAYRSFSTQDDTVPCWISFAFHSGTGFPSRSCLERFCVATVAIARSSSQTPVKGRRLCRVKVKGDLEKIRTGWKYPKWQFVQNQLSICMGTYFLRLTSTHTLHAICKVLFVNFLKSSEILMFDQHIFNCWYQLWNYLKYKSLQALSKKMKYCRSEWKSSVTNDSVRNLMLSETSAVY